MTSTSSQRPYFNNNIEELSTLVQSNRENKKVLKQILHELSFRSRPKAKALAKTVEAVLEAGAVQEQLTLPLTPPSQKAPQEELPSTAYAPTLEESSEGEGPQNEPTPQPEAAPPQPAVSLWDVLVNWFRTR